MTISIALPATHMALKITGSSTFALSTVAPLPVLEPSDILVRVAYVSINHVDGKSAKLSPSPGATSGTDFAGVVVSLGAAVQTDSFRTDNNLKPVRIGDHVMGGVFGNNPLRHNNGAFAEYVAVPARLVWHVPAGMDLATAATLPAAIATVGLSLFQHLQLPMPASSSADLGSSPSSNRPYVFVYGGGTATGALAIQILKLAGFTPITTCSPASAARLLELGAEATFDYHSPTCGAEVREYTVDSLALALDCNTDVASMSICYEALASTGGRYVALDYFPLRGHTRRSVVPDWVCTYTQFGHDIAWVPPYNLEARPDDRNCAEAWYVLAQRLLDEGRIEAHPKEERSGGLAAVADGMEEVRRGEIRGRKLVYGIAKELSVAG
jgi:aspyridone synthetase trans-acting enoyl reductase